MTPTVSLKKRTKDFITETVNSHWNEHKNVCLLSILGSKLKDKFPGGNEVLDNGLRDYLRQNTIVHVLQHPNSVQKVGAVPLKTDISGDISKLFRFQKKTERMQAKPFYKHEFWNAFIRKIKDGQVRIVTLGANEEIDIRDIAEDQLSEQTDSYQIRQTDISSLDSDTVSSEESTNIQAKIKSWLNSKDLNDEMFLMKRSHASLRGHSDKIILLLSVFEEFDDDDLARVSIPLDILSKLSSTK